LTKFHIKKFERLPFVDIADAGDLERLNAAVVLASERNGGIVDVLMTFGTVTSTTTTTTTQDAREDREHGTQQDQPDGERRRHGDRHPAVQQRRTCSTPAGRRAA